MNNLTIRPSRDFNSNSNSNGKTAIDIEENIPNSRVVPVSKSYDNSQSPARYYENVSCVKEVRNGKDEKGNIFGDGLERNGKDEKSSIFSDWMESKVSRTWNQKRTKPDYYYENAPCDKEVRDGKDGKSNIFGKNLDRIGNFEKNNVFGDGLESNVSRVWNQKHTKPDTRGQVDPPQLRSNLSFFERMGQGSVSEPTLCNEKGRGDSISLQDICPNNEFVPHEYNRATKSGSPKDRGVKGCIYVRSGGKLFKSVIETKTLQSKDDTRRGLSGMNVGKGVPLRFSQAKSNLLRFGSKAQQNSREEPDDDFEIAIFLSGINSISEKSLRKQKVLAGRKKKSESRFRQDKKTKKRRKKDEAAIMFGKQLASTLQRSSYPDPSNLPTVSRNDSGKKFCGGNKQPSRQFRDFSSESDGNEYEVQTKIRNKARRPKKLFGNTLVAKSRPSIGNRKRSRSQRYASDRKYGTTDRSRGMSGFSLYPFNSDEFKIPTSKIRDHVLWAKFESIFKKYASTSRHSAGVIPRKISTDWMTKAGVVGVILTECEADEAFRQAAGVKITMNAQEYKEFLIQLTLRMRLPYYEIYRRMCGI